MKVIFLALGLATVAIASLVILSLTGGGSSVLTEPRGTPQPEPVSVRIEIIEVRTAEGIPVSITVELEDGQRLLLRLGEAIDLDDWRFEHLDGHRRTGTTIGVTYVERPGEFVATGLSE